MFNLLDCLDIMWEPYLLLPHHDFTWFLSLLMFYSWFWCALIFQFWCGMQLNLFASVKIFAFFLQFEVVYVCELGMSLSSALHWNSCNFLGRNLNDCVIVGLRNFWLLISLLDHWLMLYIYVDWTCWFLLYG